MCCLYGLIDTKHSLSEARKSKLLHVLATAAEIRGTDASGIAYHTEGRLLNMALSSARRVWSMRHTESVHDRLDEARDCLFHANKYKNYAANNWGRIMDGHSMIDKMARLCMKGAAV